jgi:anaerobic magnesium-protoporphyrin IX monomethyl ester cyclase
LIAEGKSMMTKDNYHRFPDDEKVKGVDYQFYRDLLAGKYDAEVNRGLAAARYGADLYQGTLIKA